MDKNEEQAMLNRIRAREEVRRQEEQAMLNRIRAREEVRRQEEQAMLNRIRAREEVRRQEEQAMLNRIRAREEVRRQEEQAMLNRIRAREENRKRQEQEMLNRVNRMIAQRTEIKTEERQESEYQAWVNLFKGTREVLKITTGEQAKLVFLIGVTTTLICNFRDISTMLTGLMIIAVSFQRRAWRN